MIRMRVEHSELPFGMVRFESKVQRHQDFKGWVDHVMAQDGIEKFLEDVGVLRPIQYAYSWMSTGTQ